MKKLLILILLISNITLAEDSVQLGKGQLAPFDGFLLPKEKVIELKNQDLDNQFLKKTNQNLELINQDYEKRLTLYINQNDKLAKRLTESDTNILEKSGYFLLGAVITGVIGYGVYKTK